MDNWATGPDTPRCCYLFCWQWAEETAISLAFVAWLLAFGMFDFCDFGFCRFYGFFAFVDDRRKYKADQRSQPQEQSNNSNNDTTKTKRTKTTYIARAHCRKQPLGKRYGALLKIDSFCNQRERVRSRKGLCAAFKLELLKSGWLSNM